jgi:hypothetical protein
MKKSVLALVFAAAVTLVVAQQKVALQSNGSTTIFGGSNPFVEAYNAAQDGDTIYLPGATLNPPPDFNKRLVIYGAGHYPDSTVATNKTVLGNHCYIHEDADSIHLEGLEINGVLYFDTDQEVTHAKIIRCKMTNLGFQGSMTTPCTNVTVRECNFQNLNLGNATYCVIANNFISGTISGGTNNAIFNNILFYQGASYHYPLHNITNSSIANNFFAKHDGSVTNNCQLNTFSNNVFRSNPGQGLNTWVDNYTQVDWTTFFVDVSSLQFDYGFNFHLTDPGTYVGNDGTEVGLYGGLFPFKEGSVPSNPHIMSVDIPTMTNDEGILEVTITVGAQQQ